MHDRAAECMQKVGVIQHALKCDAEQLLGNSLQGGTLSIRLGDTTVEYSEQFRFYITTKLRNPHYAPDICTKVSYIATLVPLCLKWLQ